MGKNGNGHVYRPQRTFDDDLMALAGFFGSNGLSFDAIDQARLVEAGQGQREEKTESDRLLGAYRAHYEAFIRQQRERYVLYTQALEHARAKFKANPAKTAELSRFRRHVVRNSGVTRENGSAAVPT